MGTHGETRSWWAGFRQWRRYRRHLAALVRDDRRHDRMLSRERIDDLKVMARESARRTR